MRDHSARVGGAAIADGHTAKDGYAAAMREQADAALNPNLFADGEVPSAVCAKTGSAIDGGFDQSG